MKPIALALLLAVAPLAGVALAQEAPVAAPAAGLPIGAPVKVALAQTLTTPDVKTGDKVQMTLAAPLVLNGTVIAPEGTPVVGEVTHANPKLNGGRPGEIHVAARSVTVQGVVIPLKGPRLLALGQDLTKASMWAAGGVKGGEVEMVAGTAGEARLAASVDLGPSGLVVTPATPDQIAGLQATTPADVFPGKLTAPQPGMGKVVVFREAIYVGGGYPLDVRIDDGKTLLAVMTAGQYVVIDVAPGEHVYTSRKDGSGEIRFEVEAGQTYYIKGIAMGLGASPPTVISTATFDTYAKFAGGLRFIPLKKPKR